MSLMIHPEFKAFCEQLSSIETSFGTFVFNGPETSGTLSYRLGDVVVYAARNFLFEQTGEQQHENKIAQIAIWTANEVTAFTEDCDVDVPEDTPEAFEAGLKLAIEAKFAELLKATQNANEFDCIKV